MKELLRSNEMVFLSWVEALLKSEGVETFILDGHMSVLEGSVSAIPRRIMVSEKDYHRARGVLHESGEGARFA